MYRTEAWRRHSVTALSALGLLLAWSALALLNGDPLVLPGPWRIAPLMAEEIASGEMPRHLAATLWRVALAFALSMIAGVGLGLALGRSRTADRWLDPWLVAALNLPALVTIVLCYLWIGLNETAAVIAVAINKIPMVAVTMREGARALSPQFDDLAAAYRMPAGSRFRHVVLPQLAPYAASAARAGIALIWKIVLVVEFLGRPDGIGFKIHLYFQLFDVAMVLTYALSFVIVMLVIETFIVRPWEARATRWRRA
ncbi:ABC transporter permease subunit [Rhodobacteraceae bacterium 2CG4]|uniref:ABC transporter permease subunit n=1 Tax=Halovulum marinum TaxID=2662447 RepID=A0A6L5Z2G6_9RHOB|nr:ABC transporter permease subunit [Halovulum marinum]